MIQEAKFLKTFYYEGYGTYSCYLVLSLILVFLQPSGSLPISTMNPSAAVIFCLILLGLSGTQGIPLARTVRCNCIHIDDGPVRMRAIGKLEIIPASLSCPRVEIIATMKKNDEQRCLNPESKTIKNLMKAFSQKRSKRAP